MASLCPVPFGYLSSSVELSGMLLLVSDHTFWPRLCSAEEVFLLGQPSRMVMIRLHLFTYQHGFLRRCLPILGLLNVLGLGQGPNIYLYIYIYIYRYAFLGLSPLHWILCSNLTWLKAYQTALVGAAKKLSNLIDEYLLVFLMEIFSNRWTPTLLLNYSIK